MMLMSQITYFQIGKIEGVGVSLGTHIESDDAHRMNSLDKDLGQ